jgi:pimeloyl-ACP methyl ester carboxylesterase
MRSLGRTGRFFAYGLLAAAVLVGLFVALALLAKAQLARSNPPPGQMVDVGGYRLHIHCVGQGRTTVVIEAGLNEFSVPWMPVQQQIAQFTRTCVYDRAGLGWSDAGPSDRSAAKMAGDLNKLLRGAGVQPPLVLVGHSFGGLLTRQYAAAYRDDVVALVWVDAAHEDYLERLPHLRALVADQARQFEQLQWIQRLGLMALAQEQIPPRGLSGRALERYRACLATGAFFRGAALETAQLERNLAAVRAAPPQLAAGLPIVILRRGQADAMPALSAAQTEAAEAEWRALQGRLATLSGRSRMLTAANSGHDIHLTQPEMVVDAVRDLIGVAAR